MEWNAKWDWENLIMFNSKAIRSAKNLQPTDWGTEEVGVTDAIAFNLSGVVDGYGSDLGLGSSAKSSISASTDSSSKEGIKISNLSFEALEGFAEDFNKKKKFIRSELTGTSSVGSAEPLIGLKLGKRTYFENDCAGGNAKNSYASAIPVLSATTTKKMKSSCQVMPPPRCQVEGCNLDLSSAKEYHRKNRVCVSHSKCPKVIVGGLERRFCQQCSRFHSMSEFDEKKRSCRRRLSDHNARRRKPQQEAILFNSMTLSSPFYDVITDRRQQISFDFKNVPHVYSRAAANPTWTKGYSLKPQKGEGIERQQYLSCSELPSAIKILSHDTNRLLPCSDTRAEVLNPDLKEPMFSSNLETTPDIHRALSLLSTNICGSQAEPLIFSHHPMNENHYNMSDPVMNSSVAVPQGVPLGISRNWRIEQQPSNSRLHPLAENIDAANFFQNNPAAHYALLD